MNQKDWEELIAAALDAADRETETDSTAPEAQASPQELARRLPQLLASARLDEPPSHVVEAALGIARKQSTARAIKTFLGKLVPPTSRGPALAMRGGATPDVEPLHFQVGQYDMDLSHLPSGSLLGQALPIEVDSPELQEGDCYLYGAARVTCTELEEGGEFRFADVSPGRYTLLVESGGLRLVLPELDLRRSST